jgi:hypothetical protein
MPDEKYGIEVVKGAAKAALECLSTVYAVFVEKKGLWALIGLQGPVSALSKLDLQKVKQELSDLSEPEREALQAELKAGLPVALQPKVGSVIDLVERAIDLVEDAVDQVKKAIADGQKFVADAKALLGV